MPKTNAIVSVFHEKKFVKGFWYMSPRAWPFVTPGTAFGPGKLKTIYIYLTELIKYIWWNCSLKIG